MIRESDPEGNNEYGKRTKVVSRSENGQVWLNERAETS